MEAPALPSQLGSLAVILAFAAGALGVVAYQKAARVEAEAQARAAASREAGERASTDNLEREVNRLASRVTLLEVRARAQAAAPAEPEPSATAAPADSAAPAEREPRAQSPYDVGPIPKDPAEREARKEMVSSAVATHWKAWAAKNGLSARQSAELSALEADTAKRRLDNQAKLADHELTQPETRSANQSLADEVRRKASALLTPQQFAQFEADKGPEWGASLRKIREAEAAAAPP